MLWAQPNRSSAAKGVELGSVRISVAQLLDQQPRRKLEALAAPVAMVLEPDMLRNRDSPKT